MNKIKNVFTVIPAVLVSLLFPWASCENDELQKMQTDPNHNLWR